MIRAFCRSTEQLSRAAPLASVAPTAKTRGKAQDLQGGFHENQLRARRRLQCSRPAPRSAQDKTFELRLSHWVPPSHPLQKALEDWGAVVEKASNGTIKSKVYPSQQLGKAFDHYDMARDGIADLTYVSPGYQPGRFPIIDAGNLPFMVSNAKEGTGALDEWYRKYAEKEMKDVKFCFAFFHDPGSFHSKTKKIVVPGDIKGMKIRPAHATMATWITQLGGTNVQSSAPEVRDILDKGVADAVTFPWGSIAAVRHRQGDEISHGRAALCDQLRVDHEQGEVRTDVADAEKSDRRPLQHAVRQSALRARGPISSTPASRRSRMNRATRSITLTDAQLAEWKKSAEPVVTAWADAREEGRRRSRRHHEGLQGDAGEKYKSAY